MGDPGRSFERVRATRCGYRSERELRAARPSLHSGIDRWQPQVELAMHVQAEMSRRPGQWVTHSTLREVYESWWMSLRIDDVERPDGSHTAHEVVRGPDASGIVVLDSERGVLMIW